MPPTEVRFYKEKGPAGKAPVIEWLQDLRRKDRRGFAKCAERIDRLAQFGHELRRPHADILRDGIHELRARQGNVQYRLLYFFHGKDVAILAHAIIKRGAAVPAGDIDLAVARRNAFQKAPQEHTHEEREEDTGRAEGSEAADRE